MLNNIPGNKFVIRPCNPLFLSTYYTFKTRMRRNDTGDIHQLTEIEYFALLLADVLSVASLVADWLPGYLLPGPYKNSFFILL